MAVASIADLLARLFRETGAAHHAAFLATDGADAEWPTWYAAHLTGPLSRLLGTEVRADSLAAELRAADAAQRATAPNAKWPDYYASWFLKRYRS